MPKTDAWAFLDIRNPLCAWNVYRGTLVSPPDPDGYVSVWAAALLRRAKDGDLGLLRREAALEHVRVTGFPDRISRLRGLYCFVDRDSAERALAWGRSPNHFHVQFVAELSLAEAKPNWVRLDSNWLTYAALTDSGAFADLSWIPAYWTGAPMPDRVPIWETVVNGRAIVLGTELRERAYSVLRSKFPDSLLMLEIGRQAAWIGSDLGNCTGWLHAIENPDELALDYLMDMRDAGNEAFLTKLQELQKSEHSVNWADIGPQIEKGNLGKTPDLRPLSFRIPKAVLLGTQVDEPKSSADGQGQQRKI
ncbi:hypothetical protein [uncultured Reyranella sp.]|uniref:hypothetical protein n=1 Tax=uncultured Reyranella sp. TaxID=735512 RepID=UPI00259CECDF|nr:hypothetical protein [uncultured Reyranella sp.]